jgi:hypothetical protein
VTKEVAMREPIKEKKKSCPLCKKEYPEKDNYCRTDGQRLEITDAGSGTRLSSGPDDGYAVDVFYISKPV